MTLQRADLMAAQQRHAAHYLRRLTTLTDEFRADASTSGDEFQRLWRQIQQGHAWTVQYSRQDEAARLCVGYVKHGWDLISIYQPLPERIRWLRIVLDVARQLGDTEMEARCLVYLGQSLLFEGTATEDQAKAMFRDAAALAAREGNKSGEALALLTLGEVESLTPANVHAESARRALETALAIFRDLDDARGMLRCYEALGQIEANLGIDHLAEAKAHQDEALRLALGVGDQRAIAAISRRLADLAERGGDYDVGRAHAETAVSIARPTGDRALLANCLSTLGLILSYQGDQTASKRYYEEALTLYTSLGDQWSLMRCYNNLGWIAAHERRYAEALRHYDSVLELARQLGSAYYVTSAHINRADALSRTAMLPQMRVDALEALRLSREIDAEDSIMLALTLLGWLKAVEGDTRLGAQVAGALMTRPYSADPEFETTKQWLFSGLERRLDADTTRAEMERGAALGLDHFIRLFLNP